MEIWKDIKGYEGFYQVSNLGQVKSVERTIPHAFSGYMTIKERILKSGDYQGYKTVVLTTKGKMKTKKIHRLVAEAFIENLTNAECINHKDRNPSNNNVENLEWVSKRENNCHYTRKGATSLYKGVSMCRQTNKYISQIYINGKNKFIGRFKTEIEAHNAYLDAHKKYNLENKYKSCVEII